MRKTPRRNRRIALACAAVLALTAASDGLADDTSLLVRNVPPNVLLLVDNSGSMNNIVWHPAFDPAATPTCTTSYTSSATDDSSYSFSSNFTATQCGNTRTFYIDPALSGSTRVTGRYLNWYFSDEATPYFKGTSNNDSDNIDSYANGNRSQCLIDQGASPTYSKYHRSRITAAKDVLREVICQVNQSGDVRFGLAQFYTGSDPEGGWVKVPIADYSSAQDTAIANFITQLTANTWTPLAETLFNVYRYFQSRTNTVVGVNGSNFPAYNIKTDGNTSSYVTNPAYVPPSPLQYGCQKNFVVIITDGEPTKDDFDNMPDITTLVGDYNPDDVDPENGNEDPGDACSFCNETAFYLDDLAMFMQDHDFQLDVPGTQVIDTYTIGFTTSPPANALLQKTANVGNGLFRHSNNAEELAQVLVEQIVDIIGKSQSFTSATVPASRTTNGDSFYASYFRPQKNSPFWDGHLKNFKYTSTGEVLTADDHCAINDTTAVPPCPTNGTLQTSANAVWDAADQVPAPQSRKLYVGAGATAYGTRAEKWFQVFSGTVVQTMDRNTLNLPVSPQAAADMPRITSSPYNLPLGYTTGDLNALVPLIVSSIAGCEYGTVLGTDCAPRQTTQGEPLLLGDIFHSNPVVVGSPNQAISDPSYQQFATDKRGRERVIYAGANDGWLHAFDAGTWQTTDGGSPPQPLNPPRYDYGTGDEMFGYMPSAVRRQVWRLPGSQATGTLRSFTTVDGSPIAADVWLYRNTDSVTGALGTLLNPPVSTTKNADQWRTVVMGGLRDGGRNYYALDVTDPASSTYPGYLWEFPCDDCGNSVNPGTILSTIYMGSTWSDPVITRVKVAVDGQSTPADRWVAVVGAGYDTCGDPNSLDYPNTGVGETCDSTDPTKYERGRAIFMIDITTGRLLAAKLFSTSPVYAGAGQVGYPQLRYALPSQPAVFDLNFDGYADVIYIGDLGGQMWKWVVSATGDDPINNSLGNDSLGQPNWPFERFFAAPSNSGHYQSFFFPPTGVKRGSKLALVWGAGERANPNAGPDDSNLLNNNHLYVVYDVDPQSVMGSAPTLTDSNLVDVTALENSTGNPATCSDLGGASGYFITGRETEKFITNAVVFLGEVITGSFIPAPPGADPCNSQGTAYLYRFNLDCGTGFAPGNPDPGDDRRKAIGGGLPTRPRVSVGDLNQGGNSGGCANKVVVITSDGGIENDCPGSIPSSGVNIRTWRER